MATIERFFGKGCISNINLQLPNIEFDLFVENLKPEPTYCYSRRGGQTLISRIEGINTIKQFLTCNNSLYLGLDNGNIVNTDVYGNILHTYNDQIYTGYIKDFVDFRSRMYFIDKDANIKYFDCNGDLVTATYEPRTLFTVNNALTVTSGSNIVRAYVSNHGLSVGQSFNINGLSNPYGGVNPNGSFVVTAIDTINSPSHWFEYQTSVPATSSISANGGSGLLTAFASPIPFPSAKWITQYDGRLYILGIDNRIYASQIIVDNNTNPYFIEGFVPPDVLNSTFYSSVDSAFTVSPSTQLGNINWILPNDIGLVLFQDRGVSFFDGTPTTQAGGITNSRILTVLRSDTAVNERSAISEGSDTFILGYNNIYLIDQSIRYQILGNPHKDYIKSKDNDLSRVCIWDNMILFELGNIDSNPKRLEYLISLHSDSVDFSYKKGLTLVLHNIDGASNQSGTYTFFTNFNSKDFEIVSMGNTRRLYMTGPLGLLMYDETNNQDAGLDIPCRVITHSMVFDSQRLSEVQILGHNMSTPNIKFKTIKKDASGNWNTLITESNNVGGIGYLYTATPNSNSSYNITGDRIMFDISVFDNTERLVLGSYRIKTS